MPARKNDHMLGMSLLCPASQLLQSSQRPAPIPFYIAESGKFRLPSMWRLVPARLRMEDSIGWFTPSLK